MKFNVQALVLALALPLLTAAQCDGCDTKTIDAIGKCTHPWVDRLTMCENAPCNVKFPEDPRLQCEGDFGGDVPFNTTRTILRSTTSDTGDGTLFPMPTIINDGDSSTSSNATGRATNTATNTAIDTATNSATSVPTGTTTSTGNDTNTSTTSSLKPTGSSGAVPAFSGIGFGGGAAAMVGLAGLIGLVL